MADASDTAILAGGPASVSGLVQFHNESSDDVVVEEVVIRDEDGAEATIPVEAVTVAPGATERIALRLSFQPQTEPGDHALEVAVAGTARPIVAQVAEHRDVVMAPEALVVDNIPGATVEKQTSVTNTGNVTTYVADFGEVPLYRENAAATLATLAGTSVAAGSVMLDPDQEPVATMAVTTRGGRMAIPPGETRTARFAITVPADLSQTSRHLAMLPVGLRTIVVVVVPAGPDPEDPS